jgi:hypothetical protein
VRCEVELDIFSGMPNPTWVLSDAEADAFAKALSALPHTSGRDLSGSLGYRGMIIECTLEGDTQTIHIQAGTVQITAGATKSYLRDGNRTLEAWLRDTGRSHLDEDLLALIGRELR